jgi:DNA polymerase III subunit epsilon
MMYLFFDTETTGLPKSWKAPVTNVNNWPRMVQLAYLLYNSEGVELESSNFIIQPNGFTIPAEVSKIHGISTARAIKEGHPIITVLETFQLAIKKADFLVAHNMPFDEKIVGAEFLRHQLKDATATKNKICTMEAGTHFCKLPGRYGYKWPKLSELHYKLFHTNFQDAHNAAVDIGITAKCFWELKKRGVL